MWKNCNEDETWWAGGQHGVLVNTALTASSSFVWTLFVLRAGLCVVTCPVCTSCLCPICTGDGVWLSCITFLLLNTLRLYSLIDQLTHLMQHYSVLCFDPPTHSKPGIWSWFLYSTDIHSNLIFVWLFRRSCHRTVSWYFPRPLVLIAKWRRMCSMKLVPPTKWLN